MFYFDHDTTASKDSRILMLRKQYGGAAVDAYWSIIELLYTQETPLEFTDANPEVFALAMWLCCEMDELQGWVQGMLEIGLLQAVADDPLALWSERVGRTIEGINRKSEIARENGKKGGRGRSKKTDNKANENQTETDAKPNETQGLANESYLNINKDLNQDINQNEREHARDDPDSFPLQCLAILNEELSATYGTLPSAASRNLARQEGRYSLDDVRTMVRYKYDEWSGTEFQRNLTPQTLFSPDHFEQYIHQSKQPRVIRGGKEGAINADIAERVAGVF